MFETKFSIKKVLFIFLIECTEHLLQIVEDETFLLTHPYYAQNKAAATRCVKYLQCWILEAFDTSCSRGANDK